MSLHRVHMKVANNYIMLHLTDIELSNLENASMTGFQFIKLGDKRYNLSSIVYWWKDDEDEEDS